MASLRYRWVKLLPPACPKLGNEQPLGDVDDTVGPGISPQERLTQDRWNYAAVVFTLVGRRSDLRS